MRKKISLSLGLLLPGFLIFLYIFQLNSLTTSAWRIAEIEQQLTQLKHENTALQIKAYQTMPVLQLQELARLRNFEKITSITYLRLPSGLVAQNQ
ncbi:MAG: hypothetical protein AAB524_01575 [Patescibacteria group bacterium]